LLAVRRALRFRRLLSGALPPSDALRERAQRLAERLGLSRCPSLLLVDARVSPMLWSRIGGCVLVLPSALLVRLTPSECDALILHELAHVRRRDHWVRLVELAAAVLFWWHPAVWLARRNLRIAEEQSCDALVLRTLAGPRRTYAEGLLKTLDFLAGRGRDLPALASGAGDARHLETRLTMIMKQRTPGRMTRAQTTLLAALALAVLLLFPTAARVADENTDEPPAPDAELHEKLMELEQRSIELRHELEALEVQRRVLLQSAKQEQVRAELERVRRESDLLREEGRGPQARELLNQAYAMEQRHDLEQDRMRIEQQARAEAGMIEDELVRLMAQLEQARREGDERRAEDLEWQAREMKTASGR
jgi:cell division protein FtsB